MEIPDQFEQTQSPRHEHALARPLAPEDLVPGMYVTLMTTVIECWPCSCTESAWKSPPVYHESVPGSAGKPMRVVGVCLPFVLLQKAQGGHWTGDVRRHRLARLSDRYGAEAFKRYAEEEPTKRPPRFGFFAESDDE